MKLSLTKLEWVDYYVGKGFSVIPLKRDKKPAIPWKEYQERMPTREEFVLWFTDGSNYNIGIVTGKISNVVVVDFDSKQGLTFAKKHNFPLTPIVETARGHHFYFKYPKNQEIRNFQKRHDLAGVDLRAEGGYVVAPPSIHESGVTYEWANGFGLNDVLLADLPEIIFAKNQEDKTPLAELYGGVDEGERNNSLTRLVGSWARDNLTYNECLNQANIWNSQNNPPLDREEVEKTVKSIFAIHHKSIIEPLKQSIGFNPISLRELYQEPEEIHEYIVDDWIIKGGVSLIAGKPKVGKSTLARFLCFCIAKGEAFLDKSVQLGSVIYLALEEKKSELIKHFREMGATGEEEIYIHCSVAPTRATEEVKKLVYTRKPTLLIIDPLFRFCRVNDVNDYAQVTKAFEPINHIARDSGAHIAIVHHMGKGDRSEGDSILGSTAIFGAVDVAFLIKKTEKYRTIESHPRYGKPLEASILNFYPDTRTFSLEGSKAEFEINQLKSPILEYLSTMTEPTTEKDIQDNIEGRHQNKIRALRSLHNEGKIQRMGKGGKSDPYKYIANYSGSRVPSL